MSVERYEGLMRGCKLGQTLRVTLCFKQAVVLHTNGSFTNEMLQYCMYVRPRCKASNVRRQVKPKRTRTAAAAADAFALFDDASNQPQHEHNTSSRIYNTNDALLLLSWFDHPTPTPRSSSSCQNVPCALVVLGNSSRYELDLNISLGCAPAKGVKSWCIHQKRWPAERPLTPSRACTPVGQEADLYREHVISASKCC
jgi:hypothetical protein